MTRRVVLLALGVTSLVVIAFLAPLLSLVRDVAAGQATIRASVQAQSAAALVNLDEAALASTLQTQPNTTVFRSGGQVVGAPAQRDATVDATAANRRAATYEVSGGRAVLVPVLGPGGDTSAVVRTFVPDAELREGVGRASLALIVLGAVLLAGAGLVAGLIGRGLVRPLLSVAGTADSLRGGDLSARATPADPTEVRRIAEALNGLADRIKDLLQQEREAAADLSHRLRTPLTALRLDAEGLRDPEEAERMLAAVAGVERMVGHVIAQARRPSRETGAVTDAAAVVRERVEFWSVLADEQERPVGQDLPEAPVIVPVAADDLAAAVDALLGNVFAHTPVGTGFAVSVRAGPVPALVVEDSGSGIEDPALLGRGKSGGSSTGLGLDIVRRTAEEAGGRLDLSGFSASPPRLRDRWFPSAGSVVRAVPAGPAVVDAAVVRAVAARAVVVAAAVVRAAPAGTAAGAAVVVARLRRPGGADAVVDPGVPGVGLALGHPAAGLDLVPHRLALGGAPAGLGLAPRRLALGQPAPDLRLAAAHGRADRGGRHGRDLRRGRAGRLRDTDAEPAEHRRSPGGHRPRLHVPHISVLLDVVLCGTTVGPRRTTPPQPNLNSEINLAGLPT